MRLLFVVLILFASQAFALDADQQKGLDDTVKLLKSSSDLQKAIDADPNAKDADNKATALTGTKENKEELYGISSDVFEKIVKEANGDPNKMQEMMTEAAKNPEAFANKYFSDTDKAKVRDLATKLDKTQPTVGGPK